MPDQKTHKGNANLNRLYYEYIFSPRSQYLLMYFFYCVLLFLSFFLLFAFISLLWVLIQMLAHCWFVSCFGHFNTFGVSAFITTRWCWYTIDKCVSITPHTTLMSVISMINHRNCTHRKATQTAGFLLCHKTANRWQHNLK